MSFSANLVPLNPAPKRRQLLRPRSKKKKTNKTLGTWNNVSFAGFGRTIPTTLTATHRYCVPAVTSSVAAGGTAQIFYKANSLYDPEDAVGGHQPYLFDQLSALYEHFVVVASRMTIIITPNYETASFAGQAWTFSLMLNSDSSMAGGVQTTIEQGRNVTWANSGPNTDSIVLKSNWDIRKEFGLKTYQEAVGLSRFQGTSASDCTELTHYLVSAQNNASAANGKFTYVTVIDYKVIWSEPKDAASS